MNIRTFFTHKATIALTLILLVAAIVQAYVHYITETGAGTRFD